MGIRTLNKTYARGARHGEVRWIQEWLGLNGLSVAVDGDFGPATESAVNAFRKNKGLPQTGAVDGPLYDLLAAPMAKALAPIRPGSRSLGQLVVAYAKQHLKQHPREAGGDNRGPWVRLYMKGNEGPQWAWCAGFACFLLEQACRTLGEPQPLRSSFSCDVLAARADSRGLFVTERSVSQGATLRPGTLFLSRRTPDDWVHTGIVIKAEPTVIHTIEGNTNDEGSREGYEVCRRIRGYKKKDFVSI